VKDMRFAVESMETAYLKRRAVKHIRRPYRLR
jgi:hypothetical protein